MGEKREGEKRVVMKKLVSIAASLLIAFAPLSVLAASPSTDDNGGSYDEDNSYVPYDPCATSNPALAGAGCLYIVNGQIVTANGNGTFTTAAGNVFDAGGRLLYNIYGGQGGAGAGTGAAAASQYQFTFNHDFVGLSAVYVDDNWVDPSNYDAWSGSTIVKLKQSYINTLSNGVHTLKVTWTDGTSMSQQFTVSRGSGVPNTGESDNTAYYVMMGGALIVMAGAGYVLATNK